MSNILDYELNRSSHKRDSLKERKRERERERNDLVDRILETTRERMMHMLQYRKVQDMIIVIHLHAANCNVKL